MSNSVPGREEDVYFVPIAYSESARNFARCDQNVLILCTSGTAIVEINYRKYNIVPDTTISLSYMDIISHLYVSPDFRGYCLSLSPALVSAQLQKMNFAFLAAAKYHNVIKWDRAHARYIGQTLESLAMCKEFGDSELFRTTAIYQYFSFMNLLKSHLHSNNMIDEEQKESTPSSKKDYFVSFIKELYVSFRESREVLFYANRLAISSNYLNEVCHNVCEHSAKEVIDNCVATQIKYELCHSDKSMQQLADEYNFPSQSYLSRYYRRIIGETPTDTRKNSNGRHIAIF